MEYTDKLSLAGSTHSPNPPNPDNESIAGYLKRNTDEVHRSLESSSFMTEFLSEDLNLEKYKQLLIELATTLSPIEASVTQSPYLIHFPSVKDRDYFTSLKTDLNYFGLSDAPQKILPSSIELSSIASLAGALYVIEGSALGGMILAKAIQAKLRVNSETGLAYFSSQARLGMKRWPPFKNELERAIPRSEFESCLLSAIKVFKIFK